MEFDTEGLFQLLVYAGKFDVTDKDRNEGLDFRNIEQIILESNQSDVLQNQYELYRFLMSKTYDFCLDALAIMYVGRDLGTMNLNYDRLNQFGQVNNELDIEVNRTNTVRLAETLFLNNRSQFTGTSQDEIAIQLLKIGLCSYLNDGFKALGIESTTETCSRENQSNNKGETL